jgi:hypothetical protein
MIDKSEFLFQTTEEQKVKLADIICDMVASNIDIEFITKINKIAKYDQGVFDLREIWSNSKNDLNERKEIIKDLQDAIDDYKFIF